jgi:hypothetical protein
MRMDARHTPDVLIRKLSSCHQSLICITQLVMNFISLPQSFQNLDGFVNSRLWDQHRLKPTLQSWVLLNVLPVLIKSSGSNALPDKLPTSEPSNHIQLFK